MAITPSGHSVAVASSDIGTVHVRQDVTFVLATTDVNSNKVTAFDALIDTTLKAAIDAYIAAGNPGFGMDTTGKTIKYNAEVKSVKRGVNGADNDILLNEATDRFVIIVTISVNVS